jgi:hypothetical protein
VNVLRKLPTRRPQLPPAAEGRGERKDVVAGAMSFDYTLDFKRINFRERPDLYRVGRGEEGVLLVEPYKGEILPHWRFRTPEVARESAEKIYALYEGYRRAGDFVGMDMARKYLQMGWTRSLRYHNHRTGKKYVGPVPPDRKGQSGAHGREVAPFDRDPEKLLSARIFREKLDRVLADPVYLSRREEHSNLYAGEKAEGAKSATRKGGPVPRRAPSKRAKASGRERHQRPTGRGK